jgi:hypothetical protein
MVIFFIVDTNKSMAQECRTNFSFLDVAKCAIDHFLICKPETNDIALIESSELSRLHHVPQALLGPATVSALSFIFMLLFHFLLLCIWLLYAIRIRNPTVSVITLHVLEPLNVALRENPCPNFQWGGMLRHGLVFDFHAIGCLLLNEGETLDLYAITDEV